MADALLSVASLSHNFGALKVTDDVSFAVEAGEILGVIGPNGAGKTTLFSLLAGNMAPKSGSIVFEGADVTGLPIHRRVLAGIVRTHQVPRPFSHMSVVDNIKVAALFGGRVPRRDVDRHIGTILSLSQLTRFSANRAGTLPLLVRKRLELARALATRPRLLLVDEIAGGLTDPEVDEFIGLMRTIRDGGVSIIWIEHVLRSMRTATDRIMALANGAVLAIGSASAVLDAPMVRKGYLGE